jgi:nucleotide-binding universal stress UspA family protein
VLAWPQHLDPHLDDKLLHMQGSVVLVPLDGSALAEEALPLAGELAQQYGRGLLLLHVLPVGFQPAAGPQTYERGEEDAQEQEHQARQYLATVRARMLGEMSSAPIPVEFMVKRGNPSNEIVRTAEVHPGSAVVMSTRGRTGLARLLLGSVTSDVLRRAPVPVFIVPPNVKASNGSTHDREADVRPATLAGNTSEQSQVNLGR